MPEPRGRRREDVAVIGMGCRLPGGVGSPEAFWQLLDAGLDAIGELPPERWEPYADGAQESAAIRRTTSTGGFLADIYGFDAGYFGLTPREAALMDPQQRVALEVACEALQHAGVPAPALAGTDTGVYMGVNADDYGRRLLEDLPRIEAWTGIGSSLCAVANRISYHLDLRGPSLAVDTACSSSLVSVHLACQALRTGETSLAIAGGVMLMAGPGLTMVMDAAGALAPDGRSKSFDAAADGYGRGEGCGVLVLKRLPDAVRDGDPVLAVIRGGAVGQDGRTDGIMAPSREAQEEMLRRAYDDAGVPPGSVSYLEAHGTGTRAGDPIEAGALAAVVGAGRPADRPCLLGSVKSNIGHLEAASGVAGLIKTVLALRHGRIPASLNLVEPNPAIPWPETGLRVVAEPADWPRPNGKKNGGPRRAGVSGYGYGGTIAHLVLEEAPPAADPDRAGTGTGGEPRLYPLSAGSAEALRATAAALHDRIAAAERLDPADVGHTLAHRRGHADTRATVLAADRDELLDGLGRLARDEPGHRLATGRATPAAADPGPVWVFSGHGSQWTGMGRGLLDTEPAFAAVIDELAPVFAAELDLDLRAALLDGGEPADVGEVQPLIFALQLGLAEVWRSYGVRPGALIGHSVGEVAAAVVGGVFGPTEGARLICRRSQLLRRAAGNGAMAMVSLPFEEVSERLDGRADISAAISSSPRSTVVSGGTDAVDDLVRDWRAEGEILVQPVDSDVAFHSGHMDPVLAELDASLAGLRPKPPAVRTYPTATADPRSDPPRDGAYWAGNLRRPVRFAEAVGAAVADGHRVFLEVSPHPVVVQSLLECFDAAGVDDGVVAYSLRRNRPETAALLANLGTLHCAGVPVDWSRLQPAGRFAELPANGWAHREYRAGTDRRGGGGRGHDPDSHTLLGADLVVHGLSPVRVWRTVLEPDSRPYPGDHPVRGVEIVPACVLLNTFLTAAAGGAGPPGLADVELRVPVAVTGPHELQVVAQDDGLVLSSRVGGDDGADGAEGWLTHTTAVVAPDAPADWVPDAEDDDVPTGPALTPADPAFVVDRLAEIGVGAMGFPWRVDELHTADGRLRATVTVDPAGDLPAGWASALDAALSIASVVFPGPPRLRMPARVDQVAVLGRPPDRIVVEAWARPAGVEDGDADTADVDVRTPAGERIARFAGMRYGGIDGDVPAPGDPRRLVHELTWQPVEIGPPAGELGRAVLVGPAGPVADAVGAALAAAGVRAHRVNSPESLTDRELAPDGGTAVLVLPPDPGAGPVPDAARTGAWRLIRTAQVLAEVGSGARLWALTHGVREAADEAALAAAPLWGTGRVIAGEHPELWGGTVDLPADLTALADGPPDEDGPDTAPVPLADLLRSRPDDDVLAPRDGAVLAARLSRVAGDAGRTGPYCRPRGTYLVTGGLGTLGLRVAGWLAAQGARRIVLAGRTALPPRHSWHEVDDPQLRQRIDAVSALEATGVTVRTVAMDVADPRSVAEQLAAATGDLPPILGVVHAAGVLDSRLVADTDAGSVRAVMRPKVDGAAVLHELFPPGELDFFVLFSSTGLLFGLPGQAGYAAGNAYLDALARHRRDLGDRGAVSFGWTSWRGLGMSTSSELIDAELAARGTADVTASDAFRCWEYAAGTGAGYLAVFRAVPLPAGAAPPALLRDLPADADTAPPDPDEVPWAGLTGEALAEALRTEVRDRVATELKIGPDELDVRQPLVELGLDSVLTLIIRRALETRLRLSLPATLLWEHRTVAALADHLAERLAEQAPAAEPDTEPAPADEAAPAPPDPGTEPATEPVAARPTRPGAVPWPAEFAQRYRDRGHWRGQPLGAVMWGWADEHPDRVAVVDGDRRLTYRELAEHADALAAGLADLGLRNGDDIVVQLPNSWEFLALFLACQRIGVAPVLALLAHREHELGYLAELTRAKAFVVPDRVGDADHQELAARLAKEADLPTRVLVMGDRVDTEAGHVDLRALLRVGADPDAVRRRLDAVAPDPGEVALYLLSGGTTGIPKIIARTHDDYEYNARQSAAVTGFDADTVYGVTLPMAHNFPLGSPGILGTLISGGRVVMIRSPRPEAAFPTVAAERVTVTSLVPAIARRWVDAAGAGGLELASLRWVQVGGSVLPTDFAEQIGPALGCTLQQVYGMAEGLLNYTRLDDPPDVLINTQGRPVGPDDEVRIVDADDRPLPPGQAGELQTRGPTTPRGYFRAPEHNAKAFTADGWYRSGDIVIERPDRNLVVTGRVKDLVNRGGEKIPAAEVEALVEELPQVHTASVVPVPDPELGERVGVFVVLEPGWSLSLAEIRTAFRRNGVAHFKIPELLRVTDSLPLTAVGKVDKKLLMTLVAKGN